MPTVVLSAADRAPAACRGGAVTVGNFDGVHRGHAALMAALKVEAAKVDGPAVALTFEPHPLALIDPSRLPAALTTPNDRAVLLRTAGADAVVALRTTPDLLAIEASAFLNDVLGERFGVKAVVEGYNFRFGHDRAGDTDLLAEWCRAQSIALTVVPPLQEGGAPVSSSRVRQALGEGDVATSASLLGRSYRLRGVVGTGAKRGRTIGFPTANIERPETLVPGNGVYAVRVVLESGDVWPGAANVGPNPTFGETARKVEVHLIGFEGDLYGRPLAIDFVARLRTPRSFAGPQALAEQLRRDVQEASRLTGRA